MLQFEHFLSSFLFLQGIGKTSCAWFSSLFLLENLNTSTGDQYDQIEVNGGQSLAQKFFWATKNITFSNENLGGFEKSYYYPLRNCLEGPVLNFENFAV